MIINILDQDIIVTIIDDDRVQVNLLNPNQQQQSALEFQDEGITLGTIGTVTKVNFVGPSVVATRSGSTVTINVSGGGGSGTVSSFSAGNLSPVFTTSVANPTTTPALTFSLTPQNANLVFAGPLSGGATSPTFRALGAADINITDITATNLIKWTVSNLGVTATDSGLWLTTSTAAANGAQQLGGIITQESFGWASTGGASQSVKFQYKVLPVQGTTNPTAVWTLASSVNAAAYANRFTIDTDGTGVFGNSAGNRFIVDNSVAGTISLKIFSGGVNTFSIISNTGSGENRISGVSGAQYVTIFTGGSLRATFNDTTFTLADAINFVVGTTTGTKMGTAPSQKLGFWNATPIVQPTTAVATAARVGGGGTTVTDTDTFGGYKIGQVVQALQNSGLLA